MAAPWSTSIDGEDWAAGTTIRAYSALMRPGACSAVAAEGQACVGWCPYMPHRIAARRSMATLFAWSIGALAALGLLSGCATPGDSSVTLFADPGKYQFSSCQQLAVQRKTWTTKEQDLKQLMDRAEQGAGGELVNVLAYKTDYVQATEELKVLERAARSKHCNSPENWSSSSAIR